MDRTIHLRLGETDSSTVGVVACGLPNLNLWTDHRRKKVNCTACRTIKES